MKIRRAEIAAALLLLAVAGCGCGAESQNGEAPLKTQIESVDDTEMDQSVQLIMDAGDLERDCAQGAVETLHSLDAFPLQAAELVSNNTGVVLRVVDASGDAYYLGFGGLGYLEIVRKGSVDGEIIYAPEE